MCAHFRSQSVQYYLEASGLKSLLHLFLSVSGGHTQLRPLPCHDDDDRGDVAYESSTISGHQGYLLVSDGRYSSVRSLDSCVLI